MIHHLKMIKKKVSHIFVILFFSSLLLALPVFSRSEKIVLTQKDIITLNRIDILAYPTIFLNVIVTDEDGNPVEDLDVKDFVVFENNVKQKLDDVINASQQDEPINVVLTMDVSGSMGEENTIISEDGDYKKIRPVDKAKEAAEAFVSRLEEGDRVIVSGFADYWMPLNDLTEERDVILNSIDRLEAKGGTALFEGVLSSVKLLEELEGNKAVIVLTDGKDSGINLSLDDCIDEISGKGVPVFTIGLGTDINESNLLSISKVTGGRYFKASDSSKLDKIYELISKQLEKQYWLKYNVKDSHSLGSSVEVVVRSLSPGIQGSSSLNYITPPQVFKRVVEFVIGLIAIILLTIMFFQLFWKGFGFDPVISSYVSVLISLLLVTALFTYLFFPVCIYYKVSIQVFFTLGLLAILTVIFIIWRIKEYA